MDRIVQIILIVASLLAAFGLGWWLRSVVMKRVGNLRKQDGRPLDRQRLALVLELISKMTSTLIYSRVLELLLDLGEQALVGAVDATDPKLVSAVFLFSDNGTGARLRLETSRHMVQADQRAILPAVDGVVAKLIDEGEPILTTQIKEDPELSQIISLQSSQSLYCLPLRVVLDTYGIVIFASPKADFFTPAQQDVLGILTHQAVIALQNARLFQDLEQEKERMMETQEEARKKLARDLHDGPTQSVSAIAMRLNFTRRMTKKIDGAIDQELEKIESLALRTTKEIRHMLFTLRPLVLESQGLVAALQAMAEKMHDTYNQKVVVEVDQAVLPEMEINKQTVVFYIIEEAVNNARKYAEAETIWVRLKQFSNDLALLEIKDEGRGFDPGVVGMDYESRGSLGMVNMRERTELINGVLRVDSAPGKGTTIQVAIPLTEEAIEKLRHRG
jgi:signal transduction histidine kinase